MEHPAPTRIALILGKQGSGKTTRVLSGLRRSLGFEEQVDGIANGPATIQILSNRYNHITYDDDGDLAFVGGEHLGKTMCKVKTLQGLYAIEFPHSGYIPPASDRHLNDHRIKSKIFHLELPEPIWRAFEGSTGRVTSPEYFMEYGRKIESRQACNYRADLAKVRDDILQSGVPAVRFDNPDGMIQPILDFLLFPTNDRWTEEQLRSYIRLKMGKTRPRGHQGDTGLLGYQVVDFGHGIRSEGDTQTPEKLAFIIQSAKISVKGHTFLDLGCNMGSAIVELKKRGAAECVGFDLYEPALEIARTVNENWFQFAGVHFLHQSIVDDWRQAKFPSVVASGLDRKVDYALALSVLHKDGVRINLGQLVQNLARFARNVVVEVPVQPEGDASDWDYGRVRRLLEEKYVVERLPDSDFHSVCSPRALLLGREKSRLSWLKSKVLGRRRRIARTSWSR